MISLRGEERSTLSWAIPKHINKNSARISHTRGYGKMTCEKCSAKFSRKKCLHQFCPAHQAEVAAFQKEIDEHVQELVVRAWHPRTKAPEVQASKTKDDNVVSRIQSPKNHHYHSAKTSGSHSPEKTRQPEIYHPEITNRLFLLRLHLLMNCIASDLLPMRPPIF